MDPMASSSTGTRAPYGRACTNCSRVKCRCIYQVGDITCERCQRLKKDCLISTSSRKHSMVKLPVSRTARLEQKVDGLVSFLRSQATVNQLHPELSDTPLLPTQSIQVSIRTPQSVINVSPSQVSDEISDRIIANTLTEEHLAIFRQSFLPFFPFVYIPTYMSVSSLRIQKPFFSLVILSLTTKSVSQQLAIFETIRQTVSEKAVAEHERSLDFLLGLICYLAWSQYHKNKSYLNMWTQIAVTMVFDLGIHKAGSRDTGRFPVKPKLSSDQSEGSIRSKEERRAILAVFIVSSMVWTNLRQLEGLRWTPYMDDCVRVLREEKETTLDLLLVFQAKCHVVVEQISHSSFEWGLSDGMAPSTATYFVKALQQQLQDIWQSVPAEMRSERIVLLSLYSTEVTIKETMLCKSQVQDQIDLRRLRGLESLLTTIERWYEEFYRIPLLDWIGISFEVFAQFWNCLTILFQLTTLDEPGWDKEEVRKRVDLLRILEDFAQGFERLPEAVGLVDDTLEGEIGAIFRAAPHIRATKAKFMGEMMPASLQSVKDSGTVEISDDFEMCFTDDPWLREMFEFL